MPGERLEMSDNQPPGFKRSSGYASSAVRPRQEGTVLTTPFRPTYRYIADTRSGRVHDRWGFATCPELRVVAETDCWPADFDTLAEAVTLGFVPCPRCCD